MPYEAGWSAKVDGADAKILQVNNGFMAVLADSGDHTITFTYKTPGLSVGILITLCSVLIFLLYLWWMRKRDAKLSLRLAQESAANEKIAAENRSRQSAANTDSAPPAEETTPPDAENASPKVISPDDEIAP